MLFLVLKIVLVITALGLTVLVVFQDNRGGGLAGVLAGAGGESAFGTETVSKVKKLTAYLGVLFFAVVLVLAVLGQRSGSVVGGSLEEPVEETPAPDAGSTEPAPVPTEPALPETP